MSVEPKWTLDDLVTRYDLEPKLRDVFVEGTFDQEVLHACFKASGDERRICYPIDVVDIPSEILRRHALTDGNKQRVMALAIEFDSAVEGASCKCLVDSDLDYWVGQKITASYLIRTKFTSLDLYFFSEELLKRLLINSAKAKITDWTAFFDSLIGVLKDLYALRLVDSELDLRLKWSSWEKCVERNAAIISFDVNDYMKRVLLTNKQAKIRTKFAELFQGWRAKLTTDPRLCIRGHDFIEVVSCVIGKFGGRRVFSTPEWVEGAFLLVAEEALDVLDELN